MKKVLLSLAVIGVFAAYAIHQRTETGEHPVIAPQHQLTNPPTSTQTTGGSSAGTPMHMMNTTYKDGTYTGSVADAFYGMVQVRATISGGKITEVTFLQYPNDRGESIQINSQAMPYLKQEAIQAQNANVDIVTGATQTSLAFQQSLGSALSQAR